MRGPNGKHVIRITMDEYIKWQSWDEWPEREDNPPLTVETLFWYDGQEYMVTRIGHRYAIVTQPAFKEVISNENFKDLLEMPFLNGKSFRALIREFLFEE
ncbi:hypothetical protein SAMN02745190_01644 [Schwartzia succinivorans DSM 10502]|uniref:Uncharacterized protein n=2 Tax=Schwartzia TaxID=55506 RepID=A0A1M4Y6C8_9FIRM|nr:hypothetical protein SAMN02745190_01644 [Schwartzia succinivorans DSM 10502]